MKLGEIKLEALMMIYPGEVFNVDEDNLEEALGELKSDPNFSDYLANMPGIINRCFGVLENKGVLPTKQAELSLSQGEYCGPFYRYRLREKITDFSALEKIIYVDRDRYEDMCDYRQESSDVVLVPWQSQGNYIFVYVPKTPRISVLSVETTPVLEEREDIASLIPYYIKSELLYTEHPDDAKVARSLFEQGISELVSHKESYQSAVETVYRV